MRSFLLLALLLTLVACGSKPKTADAPPPVVYAEGNDPAMNDAIQRAREELATFETVLTSPQPNQIKFGVKVSIPHSGGAEHLWLGNPVFDGDSLSGVVEDVPIYAKNISRGEKIRVHRHGISDWMYMEDGRLRGGYTIRVGVDQLPDDQRAEQKKQLGIE